MPHTTQDQPGRLGSQEATPTPFDLSSVSDDAKAVLGSHFGMMDAGRGHVTFQTPWNRTARGAAALAELVAAGALGVVEGEQGRWAWTYRARVDCFPAYKWLGRHLKQFKGFTLMVPSAERSERPPRGWKRLSDGHLEAKTGQDRDEQIRSALSTEGGSR